MIEINNYIFAHSFLQIFFIFGLAGLAKIITPTYSEKFQVYFVWNIIFLIIFISCILGYYFFLSTVNHSLILFFLYCISGLGIIFTLLNYKTIKKLDFNNYKILIIFFILYFILSLSPPTDIDSIDYHLGAPLTVFENKSFFPRSDWLHYRLVGLGENLNIIGIYFKTFNIGQVFQFLAILIIISFSWNYLSSHEQKKYFSLYILSCPLFLFLLTSQKFQLFPAALIYCSIIFLVYEKSYNNKEIFYILCALCFAIGCKFSYVIPSFLVWVFLIYRSIKDKKFIITLVISIFTFLFILVFQHYLKNYLFYGDPLSPILEGLKQNPDQNLIKYLNFNKTFSIDQSNIIFLISLFLPLSFGVFTTSLGPLSLMSIFLKTTKMDKKSKILIIFSIITFILIFFSYRGISRYYLEIFFIIGFIIFKNFENLRFKKIFKFLVWSQSVIILIILIYSNITFSSGILSKRLWESVLSSKAFGYDVAKWAKQETDFNTYDNTKILLSDIRFYSFFKKNFVSHQYYKYGKLENTKNLIIKENIKYILYPEGSFAQSYFEKCVKPLEKKEKDFDLIFRNPFNTSQNKQIYFLIKINKVIC